MRDFAIAALIVYALILVMAFVWGLGGPRYAQLARCRDVPQYAEPGCDFWRARWQ